MLKIQILANNVQLSLLTLGNEERGTIDRLPGKLRTRVLEVVNKLNESDVRELEYNKGHFVLTHRDKNCTIDPCPAFLNDDFLVILTEACTLLHWYLSPHFWINFPGVVGGSPLCLDCRLTQPHGVPHGKYCAYEHCSSHAKWAQIIEGYEPPVNQNAGALGRMMRECLENNKVVSTEGPHADEANEWIQKG